MFSTQRVPLVLAAVGAALIATHSAQATLMFYYDPATGAVAMDTTQTRSGGIYLYLLDFGEAGEENYEFRHENLLDLTGSGIITRRPDQVSGVTLSNPLSGYYTLGEILPPGIPRETWFTLFDHFRSDPNGGGHHTYTDVIGGNTLGLPPVPPADFFYGLLDREFDNKWDIVDPDTLTWANHVTLVYRPYNGELLVDTTGPGGGHITSVLLKSDAQFLPEGFAPFIEGPLINASESSVAIFADAIEPGRHSLGQVLPSGLSLEEFEAAITQAKFISRAGFNRPTYNFDDDGGNMALAYQVGIPEPTTLAITFVFAGIAAASSARRGRRNTRGGSQS